MRLSEILGTDEEHMQKWEEEWDRLMDDPEKYDEFMQQDTRWELPDGRLIGYTMLPGAMPEGFWR